MSEDLAKDTQSLDAETQDSQPKDCLPFNPLGSDEWIKDTLEEVPRYLFRVATPTSGGQTTKSWAKSKDAANARASSQTDIFVRSAPRVANMLDKHLWKKENSKFDNFVSWSCSLLYAIQYIFYRHHEDRTSLDKIDLYIVDTAKLPKGAFVRDMDLISVFGPLNAGLQKLQGIRNGTAQNNPQSNLPDFLRSYYFGEYLSQGALKIEACCSVVSAQEMLDAGLLDLRGEFRASRRFNLGLDERMKHLRKIFAQREEVPRQLDKDIQAAVSIGQLFGPGWSVPVAAALMALRPCQGEDIQMICKELKMMLPSKSSCIIIKNID